MYDLIKRFENCKLKSYKCPAGVWTIGWGTTVYPDGLPVKEGDIITQAQADYFLDEYVKKIKLPAGLNKNQIEALQSLIYNIGQSAFDKSNLKKAIINQDWKNVYKNWDWITANGVFLRGLAIRRAAELELFFS